MKNRNSVLLLAFILLTFSAFAQLGKIIKSRTIQERNNKQYYIHTVKAGQTAYSISKVYRVSLDEIYDENPGSKNGLEIGQKLWIPVISKETKVKREVAESNFDYFYHIAKQNENFSNVANIYSVPKKYIKLANPILKEPFKAGEYVKIPSESAFPILDGKQQLSDNSSTYVSAKTGSNTSFNPNVKVLETYRHVVKNGESLKGIAAVYHITVTDLKTVNPGLNTITAGDRLRLPSYAVLPGSSPKKNILITNDTTPTKKASQTQTTKASLYYKYTTHKGDNIYNVARKFGVTPDELYKANAELTAPNLISGTTLLIPKVKTRPHFIYYRVRNKTRLRKIAKLFGISNKQIKQANRGTRNRVYAGQLIKIPGGEKAVLLEAKPEIKKDEDVDKPTGKYTTYHCKPKPYRGKTFNIALMVPLFLEEIDQIDPETFNKTYHPDAKSFRFIEFLEGAYIAIDSLKKMGYNIKLYVYDVDNQITKTTKVLQHEELKHMNLIIGPFYGKSFHQVAIFAEKFNIPIVNPFTFRDKILYEHKNVIKVKPGINSQIPLLTKLIKNRYSNYKVFFITQNNYKNADAITKVRTALTNSIPANINISNVTINNISIDVDNRLTEEGTPGSPYYNLEGKAIDPATIEANLYDSTVFNNRPVSINFMVDTIRPFLNKASVVRKNLVIIYGDNKSYLMDVINKLNVVRDTFNIEIIGLPRWEQIKNMDYMLLNNLNLTYFSSEYIDYNAPQTKQFIKEFRQHYYTEPEKYGFSGFDITLYFTKMLTDYDKRFLQCLPSKSTLTLENGFKFEKVGDSNKNNFENVMWNIIEIKDFKTTRLPESNLIPLK